MLNIIRSFISGKALLVLLALALASSGWLLLKSHQQIGSLKSDVTQWQAANQHWSDAWQNREQEITSAAARMATRDHEYQTILGQLHDYQKKLRAITDINIDSDCGLRPDVWMLIRESARDATGSLPDSQPGTTADN